MILQQADPSTLSECLKIYPRKFYIPPTSSTVAPSRTGMRCMKIKSELANTDCRQAPAKSLGKYCALSINTVTSERRLSHQLY
jgi:hypothetical protein